MLSNDRITVLEAKVNILEAFVAALASSDANTLDVATRYQDILEKEKENDARS